MAILINKDTRLITIGITGKQGTFHTKGSEAYGTKVVGGVTPGKGGTVHEGWPVFNTVKEAVKATDANAAMYLFHLRLQLMPSWNVLKQNFQSLSLSLKGFLY